MRRLLRVVWALILVFCVILIATGYALTKAPRKTAEMTPVVVSQQAANQAKDKIAAVDQAVQNAQATNATQDVTLEITQQEATSLAAEALAQGQVPLDAKNVQVNFRQGKIVTSATINVSGVDLPVVATASVSVVNGTPVVNVESVDAGWIPVPDYVRQQINDAAKKEIATANVSIDVTSVQIQNGTMIVQGQTK